MAFQYAKQYRLPGYDYSATGYYFITICTHNRECYFGDILLDDGGVPSMALSPIGKIARDCWLAIPKHFDFVSLDEWIIIPNHVHGIIIINNTNNNRSCRNAINRVPTTGGFAGINNPMSRNSLGKIIRWFKGRTKYECGRRNLDFFWQPRFHDHIIRNERELYNIRRYIQNNVINWHKDINNPKNFPIDQ